MSPFLFCRNAVDNLHILATISLMFNIVFYTTIHASTTEPIERRRHFFHAELDIISTNPCANLTDLNFDEVKRTAANMRDDQTLTNAISEKNPAAISRVEDARRELAYLFCTDVFTGLFINGWKNSHQSLLKTQLENAPNYDQLYSGCRILRLLAPDWTVSLLRRTDDAAIRRLRHNWAIWRRENKLKEIIFHLCTATFANEPDAVYVEWVDEISKEPLCPLLINNHADSDEQSNEIQTLIDNTERFSTKSQANESRRMVAFEFCRMLLPENLNLWKLTNISNREQWFPGMDMLRGIFNCSLAALLQPEARMMMESYDIEAWRKQQLMVLVHPTSETTNKKEFKETVLAVCKFAFGTQEDATTTSWLLIIVVCSVVAALLLLSAIILLVYFLMYRRQQQKSKRGSDSTSSTFRSSEDSARTIKTLGGHTTFEDTAITRDQPTRFEDSAVTRENLKHAKGGFTFEDSAATRFDA